MTPTSPVVPGYEQLERKIAEHQDEYNTLPAIVTPDGIVISRWQLTWRERFRLLFGGSIYLWNHTFGQPLQPVCIETAPPQFEGGTQ